MQTSEDNKLAISLGTNERDCLESKRQLFGGDNQSLTGYFFSDLFRFDFRQNNAQSATLLMEATMGKTPPKCSEFIQSSSVLSGIIFGKRIKWEARTHPRLCVGFKESW